MQCILDDREPLSRMIVQMNQVETRVYNIELDAVATNLSRKRKM